MRLLIIVLLGSLFIFSCGTPQRAVYNYLEDIRDTTFKKNVFIAESVIQKNDLLSIQVYSASLDPSVDALYNTSSVQGAVGYLVDVNGNIDVPRMGKIHAEGMTKSELEGVIKEKLRGQLNQPGAVVRFLNFRITVLGEVGNPGVLNVPTERLTILEAVGMSGGVTQFGKIKEVKILRENNGKRQMGTLDLTSQNIFQSPYYQLQQNDVILVDQNRYKLRQTEQTRISQQIGFALSIITSIALLYNIFR
ncbi:MAG: polysaccharide biosynthesis/export family protein [Flavisolibacter sp.]|nr:polysaccharide biosynthesis/export family protein [Flavisolibacter sp.]